MGNSSEWLAAYLILLLAQDRTRTNLAIVGTPVNMAARLCSAAADGEILVDQPTAHLSAVAGLHRHADMHIKGAARRSAGLRARGQDCRGSG